jgi:hypothetical protein
MAGPPGRALAGGHPQAVVGGVAVDVNPTGFPQITHWSGGNTSSDMLVLFEIPALPWMVSHRRQARGLPLLALIRIA